MELLQEGPETIEIHTPYIVQHVPISKAMNLVAFDEEEYQYLRTLMDETCKKPCVDVYCSFNIHPHRLQVPVEFLLNNLRLLILADHVVLPRREGFMDDLRKLLGLIDS